MKLKFLFCITIILNISAVGCSNFFGKSSDQDVSSLMTGTVSSQSSSFSAENPDTIIETEPTIETQLHPKNFYDAIIEIHSGDELFLDDSGTKETVEFQITDDADTDQQLFTIRVGDASINITNQGFHDACYIFTMSTPFEHCPVFLVSSYMNETVRTDIIVYSEGQLFHAGMIPDVLPSWMSVSDGCIVTDYFKLETQYTLAGNDTYWYDPIYAISEVPQGMKPYGNIVTALEQIPIYEFRYGETVAWMASQGDMLILSANDSQELFFVQSLDGTKSGWIQYDKDSFDMILSDGSAINMYQAFSGLPSSG